jgi:F-type H+-transporting ATPase subunit b
MTLDEPLVVAISFFLFVAFAYKPLGRFLAKTLDARAARISHELADAVRLREEAQKMLEQYERKYREVEAESAEMLRHAEETIKGMYEQAETTLKTAVEARMLAANEKIRRAEERAVQDVQRQVVDVAMEAARQIIIEKMHNEADDTLIQLALKDVNRIVH